MRDYERLTKIGTLYYLRGAGEAKIVFDEAQIDYISGHPVTVIDVMGDLMADLSSAASDMLEELGDPRCMVWELVDREFMEAEE